MSFIAIAESLANTILKKAFVVKVCGRCLLGGTNDADTEIAFAARMQ